MDDRESFGARTLWLASMLRDSRMKSNDMLYLVQETTIKPRVVALKMAMSMQDYNRVLDLLNGLRQALMLAVESFPDVIAFPLNDVCGIGVTVGTLMKQDMLPGPIALASCQMVAELCKYPDAVLRDMIESGVIGSLVRLLSDAYDADIVDASLDTLCRVVSLFPTLTLKANAVAALLDKIDFVSEYYRNRVLVSVHELSMAVKSMEDFDQYFRPYLGKLRAVLLSARADETQLCMILETLKSLCASDRAEICAEIFGDILGELRILYLKNIKVWSIIFQPSCMIASSLEDRKTLLLSACQQYRYFLDCWTATFPLESLFRNTLPLFHSLLVSRIGRDSASIEMLKSLKDARLEILLTLDAILFRFPCDIEKRLLLCASFQETLASYRGEDVPEAVSKVSLRIQDQLSYVDRSEEHSMILLSGLLELRAKFSFLQQLSWREFEFVGQWPSTFLTIDSGEARRTLSRSLSLAGHPVNQYDRLPQMLLALEGMFKGVSRVSRANETTRDITELQRQVSLAANRFVQNIVKGILSAENSRNEPREADLTVSIRGFIRVNTLREPQILEISLKVVNPYLPLATIVDQYLNSGDSNEISWSASLGRHLRARKWVNWSCHSCKATIGDQTFYAFPERPIASYFNQLESFQDGPLGSSERLAIKFSISPASTNGVVSSPTPSIDMISFAGFEELQGILAELGALYDDQIEPDLEKFVNPKLTLSLSILCHASQYLAIQSIPAFWRFIVRQHPQLFRSDTKVDYLFATVLPITRCFDRVTAVERAPGAFKDGIPRRKAKFIIDRSTLIANALEIMDKFAGDKEVVLDFAFKDDVGTGLVPWEEYLYTFLLFRDPQCNFIPKYLML